MIFIYFGLSVLCMAFAIHPFTTYPLTLWLIRQKHRCPINSTKEPVPLTYAICVCAYNEEDVIRDKAENLLSLKKIMPSIDVKIYIDGSTDRTAEILEDYKNDFDIHVSTERNGKTHGMNFLVEKTQAQIVIFSDANVMLDVESIPMFDHYFSDPDVGCVCGHLKYVNMYDSPTADVGTLYWRLEEIIKELESETGSVMGADGSLFAIRRRLHKPVPPDIIDDMFLSLSILCDGYRIIRAEDIIAYERATTDSRQEFKRKTRIACQAFNAHRLLWPRLKNISTLDHYKYLSHKFLRWLTIFWIFLAFSFFELHLLSADHQMIAASLVLFIGMVLFAGIKFHISPIMKIMDIFLAFLATGLGVLKSLQGERFQTWTPEKSSRKN